jgi:hypothetical protein
MNGNSRKHDQQGIALILSLLLLFVMLILGIAGFSNTHIQERSAGNARLQTLAFEAASAGANNAINFFDTHRELGDDELCGATGHEGWESATDWVDMGNVGSGDNTATLRQRMYCLADAYPCSVAEEDEGLCTSEDRPPRSQLFVQSRGEVTIDGDVVAQRDVEVRLEVGNPGGGVGDGCTAICFPSCEIDSVAFPTSNSFQVDGNGEPAITAGCQAAANDITAAIRDNRIGNYDGGIEFATPGAPWDSVSSVEQFRLNLQAAAAAAQGAGTCQTSCVLSGTDGDPYVDNGNSDYGSVGDPQITYVEGNAEFGGGISGAGILVVNGNLAWNGTPNFQGLILVLGGTYEVIGGGTGGDHGGSVVLLNAVGAEGDEFGATTADFTGGGTALYQFDCSALWAAHDLLDEAGQEMWSPECDVGPENVFQAGPPELVIASWRENIGWREFAE